MSGASAGNVSPPLQILRLYRRLLKNAKQFPSIKRDTLYEDIRAEFRDHKNETDPKKLAQCVDAAVRGVKQMEQYTNLSDQHGEWSIQLEEDPLGAAEHKQRQEDDNHRKETNQR